MTGLPAAVGGWVAAAGGWTTAVLVWTRARALAGAREEHVARVAHEVRGPLTAAGLAVELARRSRLGGPEALRAVEFELVRAGAALEDISRPRTAAAASAAVRPAGPIEVARLLGECVAAACGEAVARGAEVRLGAVPPGLIMTGDQVRVAQAVRNLIGNAIEHGAPQDGSLSRRSTAHVVEVSARVVGAGPHAGAPGAPLPWVRIEVADRGGGLPRPVAELIAGARGGRGRRGRGLAIAAGVAAAHGGRLLSAPLARGARLVLELPARDAAPPAHVAPVGDTAAAGGVAPHSAPPVHA